MGLLDILKSVIGLGGSESASGSGATESGRQDVDVTIEHEPAPDTESEAAVKGTDDAAAEAGAATEGATRTGPSVEEGETADTGAAIESETAETDTADVEATDAETADAEQTDEAADETAEASPDVETIKGIGPSYADSLAEAGIETVADLAAADPAEVADRTGISEKRVSRWIDRAGDEE